MTSEYGDLLSYLEDEQDKVAKRSQQNKQVQQVKKEEIEKKSISDETRRFLKESLEDIHADVTFQHPAVLSSRGFSVDEFEGLMRAKLVDEHKRLQSYERPYISVTEVLSCLRQKFYVRLKYSIDVKSQYGFSYLYMINKVGNVVHDIIQDLYNFSEVEKTIISDKYSIKGRIDGIKDNFVYEIKTIDSAKFDGGYLESHYQQGLIYGHILNEEYNYNIDTIVIIYVTRDLKRIIPFDLPLDESIAKSLLTRSIILRDSLDTKSVPEPIGADKEQCKWCSYKNYCEKDGAESTIPFLEKKQTKKKNKPVFMLG